MGIKSKMKVNRCTGRRWAGIVDPSKPGVNTLAGERA